MLGTIFGLIAIAGVGLMLGFFVSYLLELADERHEESLYNDDMEG